MAASIIHYRRHRRLIGMFCTAWYMIGSMTMSPSTSRSVVLEVYLGGLTGLYAFNCLFSITN
ncbi:hypothetical protein F5888DRAFT_1758850, partial [Russula emetica]